MPTDQQIEAENLIEEAEKYAERVYKDLALDPEKFEPPNDLQFQGDSIQQLAKRIIILENSLSPNERIRYKRMFLIIHFLFPMLLPAERLSIENMAFRAQWYFRGGVPHEEHRIEYLKFKSEVDAFEAKLTAMQMAILETEEFSLHP
jgi:hypothetical protein